MGSEQFLQSSAPELKYPAKTSICVGDWEAPKLSPIENNYWILARLELIETKTIKQKR